MITAALLFLITAYPAFLLLTAVPIVIVIIFIVCWLSLLGANRVGAPLF